MSSAMIESVCVKTSDFLSDDNNGYSVEYILHHTLIKPIIESLLPSFVPVSDDPRIIETPTIIAVSSDFLVVVERKDTVFAISLQVATNDLAAMIALKAVALTVFNRLKLCFNII